MEQSNKKVTWLSFRKTQCVDLWILWFHTSSKSHYKFHPWNWAMRKTNAKTRNWRGNMDILGLGVSSRNQVHSYCKTFNKGWNPTFWNFFQLPDANCYGLDWLSVMRQTSELLSKSTNLGPVRHKWRFPCQFRTRVPIWSGWEWRAPCPGGADNWSH